VKLRIRQTEEQPNAE